MTQQSSAVVDDSGVDLQPVKPGHERRRRKSRSIPAPERMKVTVTLEGPLGKQRTFKVNPKVDLSAIKKGDDIVLRVTDALAIEVTSGTGQ